MAKIKCKVEECAYNSDSDCQAQSIEVASSGTNAVDCADHTACITFRCR
ncbi:MAG: DUF1540 domain-containing protein [Bacillota bacterium]